MRRNDRYETKKIGREPFLAGATSALLTSSLEGGLDGLPPRVSIFTVSPSKGVMSFRLRPSNEAVPILHLL